MRTIPGVALLPIGMTSRSQLRFSRRSDCVPAYYIDGVFAAGYNIDDMPVSDVEGIELYAGFAGLPAQYTNRRANPACGTVIIWTRIPGKK